MQEKLSLVARFGVSINFSRPDKKEFNEIVLGLAAQCPQIQLPKEELMAAIPAVSQSSLSYICSHWGSNKEIERKHSPCLNDFFQI